GKCIDVNNVNSYKVFIDGVSRTLVPNTNWFPGLQRSDLSTAFPGLCNTDNALAAYVMNSSALGLTLGLHTISWNVVDSGGKIAGIGSRFFYLTSTTSGGASAPVAAVNGPIGSHMGFARRLFDASPGLSSDVVM